MRNTLRAIFCALVLCTHSALCLWDFAVTTNSKIIFYDEHWHEITSSAHQFDRLSAITFDETEEMVYFSDELHNNGSIFSLRIPEDHEDPHIIEKMVQRTQNETIRAIAYDSLNRHLYWSDILSKRIYYVPIDASELAQPKIFLDFGKEDTLPDGIAIDVCRRTLYWTNSNFTNATIERINLDGSDRRVIVRGNLFAPHGIIVDQLADRIYYVVDQQGIYFSVESANLDGSDRHVILKGLNNEPFSLAVTKDAIFWTDLTHRAIWGHAKFAVADENEQLAEEEEGLPSQARKILSFADKPRGIVARMRFLTNMQNDLACHGVVTTIKNRLLTPQVTRDPVDIRLEVLQREYCLNGGEYSSQSTSCICKIGYKGARCDVDECLNYCVHGTCSMSSLGFPTCACQRGFYGARCQSYRCAGYCLNEGLCKIGASGEPSCECTDTFGGQRCEQNSTEICSLFCRILKLEPDTYVPYGCHDICEELSQQSDYGAETYAIPKYQHLEVCKSVETWTSAVIIVLVCGVVASLALVLLIVHGLRRFYKPARPRIKKTFVVRTQAAASSDTPLTNRPIATEQCEITIENCCNMNICDTPCFDPKFMEQTLARNSSTKEDKKMLIHNMEDELY